MFEQSRCRVPSMAIIISTLCLGAHPHSSIKSAHKSWQYLGPLPCGRLISRELSHCLPLLECSSTISLYSFQFSTPPEYSNNQHNMSISWTPRIAHWKQFPLASSLSLSPSIFFTLTLCIFSLSSSCQEQSNLIKCLILSLARSPSMSLFLISTFVRDTSPPKTITLHIFSQHTRTCHGFYSILLGVTHIHTHIHTFFDFHFSLIIW